ncbi:unknown [Ruminococcus sp. CAG:382]|nr:unknown [Ruminococcus sp. CAG:382]
MRFVLEKQQPRLGHAIGFDIYFHRAGVYFLALVELVKPALFFQSAYRNRRNIHKADGLCASESLAAGNVILVGLLHKRILKGHAVNLGEERGMAAMVRPVGVDHTYFRNRGVALFADKIALAERRIISIHGKSVFSDKCLQSGTVKRREAVKRFHVLRHIVSDLKRFGHIK